MKRVLTALLLLAVFVLAVSLPACNTTKGFGKDVEKAGDGIKNSADRNGAQ